MAKRIPQLDAVRGTILLVMLHHQSSTFPSLHLERLFANGWMGVDLFFVLSGFLITGILADTRQSEGYFRNFYARRCLRIWPLYYSLLVFMFAIVPRLGPSEARTVFDKSSPKHAARLMIRQRDGLIVEVTENDIRSAGGNPLSQSVKLALKGLAFNMAAELKPHGVAAVAITPGFLRSEAMLEHLGVTEANWREGGRKDKNFLESESPLFVGRVVAAPASDRPILERSGQLLSSWGLAREYPFTDGDGRSPDWERSTSISRCTLPLCCRSSIEMALPEGQQMPDPACRSCSTNARKGRARYLPEIGDVAVGFVGSWRSSEVELAVMATGRRVLA